MLQVVTYKLTEAEASSTYVDHMHEIDKLNLSNYRMPAITIEPKRQNYHLTAMEKFPSSRPWKFLSRDWEFHGNFWILRNSLRCVNHVTVACKLELFHTWVCKVCNPKFAIRSLNSKIIQTKPSFRLKFAEVYLSEQDLIKLFIGHHSLSTRQYLKQ